MAFCENILAASFRLQSIFREITFLLAISPTVILGMLLMVFVSKSRILSISSLPTISPIMLKLFTGVGPILTVSPRFKSLILPSTFMAASHSAGCGTEVNSIFATEISSNLLLFL